jgi:signal transduction histidine kinase
MKLRSQIYLISIIFVLAPLLVLGGVFLSITRGYAPMPPKLYSYIRVQRWVQESFDLESGGRLVMKPGAKDLYPRDLGVFDLNGRPVYWKASPPPWPTYAQAIEMNVSVGGLPGPSIFSERFQIKGQAAGIFLAIRNAGPGSLADEFSRPWQVLIIYLVAFTLTAIGVGIWLQRWSIALQRLNTWISEVSLGRKEGGDLQSPLRIAEFQEVAQTVERLQNDLESERVKRERFLASVSHDLNTPLTSIKGYIEALRDGVVVEPGMKDSFLEIIGQKSELLSDRIQRLLDYARMETDLWKLDWKEYELDSFLSDFCKNQAKEAHFLGAELSVDLTGLGQVRASFDKVLVVRALENILSNAYRHGASSGPVDFVARSWGETFRVEICDVGEGIPLDELEKIFEPFYRGRRASLPGSGLGLYISQTVCRSHGWKLSVTSTLGKGTRFRIEGPISSSLRQG